MSDPFLGEIRMFAGNFAPQDWALCNGALLPISGNEALFALVGVVYGGDGQTTFAIPDLRGRVPLHVGSGNTLGQTGGAESVALTTNQIPAHGHQLVASTTVATLSSPVNALTGAAASKPYRVPGATGVMAATTIGLTGGSQPHNNLQPYLAINYIISLVGIFPTT